MSENLPNHRRSIDSLLFEFDRRWHLDGQASIADHLQFAMAEQRGETLLELVKIDLQNRWTKGTGRYFEDYLTEFPELRNSAEIRAELLDEELIARRIADNPVKDGELESRFGDRAGLVRERWVEISNRRTRSLNSTSPTIVDVEITTDLKGSNLHGRYEIRDLAGQGSHADVYRAWDITLRREVAIKISRKPLAEGTDEAKRFLREAESIAHLQHPGIVSVFEFGRHDRQLFIVEELMSSGTLNERLENGPVDPAQAVGWMRQICDAVDYAHLCGVIHRDLKPANVLVDHRGHLRVGDFGLAGGREADSRLTHDGMVLGTPAYMSPEQVRGNTSPSPLSDVYSLGAMLYQMLTGSVPFKGLPASVMNQIVHVEPIRPRRRNPAVPGDLEIICLKALAKEPDRRYGSARELGEDLGRYLDNVPLRAKKTGWLDLVRLWVRRQPAMAAVVAVSAVLICTILVTSFVRITGEMNRFRSERDRSNAHLHRSLLANVQNELRVKSGGWYERAMDLLKTASITPDPNSDNHELRDLATEVLLDTSARLEQVARFEPDETAADMHSAIAVAFDNDGLHVLTGKSNGSVELLRLDNHQVFHFANLDGPVRAVSIDEWNGGVFALANNQLWRWSLDLKSPGASLDGPAGTAWKKLVDDVTAFETDPAGHQLVCGTADGQMAMYRLEGNEIVLSQRWQAHDGPLVDVEFSADGILCGSSGSDRFAKCWESNTGTMICSYLASNPPRSLGFSFDGTRLVWTSFESFSLFSLTLTGGLENFGQWARAYRGVREIGNQEQVTISTDGHLTLWQNRRPIAEVSSLGEPVSLAISSNARKVVAGFANGLVCVWRLAKTDVCERFRSIHSLDLDSQGNAWNESGKLDQSGTLLAANRFCTNNVLAMDVGRGVDFVVCTNRDRKLLVWNGGENKSVDLPGTNPAITVAVGNHDRWVVSCSESGPVLVHDRETLELLREIPVELGKIYRVAANSNGTEIAVAGRTGTELVHADGTRTVLNAHVQFAGAIAFGASALAVPLSDGRILIFSTDGRLNIGSLPSQKQGIRDSCFSPDGERLYCLNANNDVACWDWANESLIQKVSLESAAHLLLADPLGEYLLALTYSQNCKVLDAGTLQRLAQISAFRPYAGFSPDGSKLRHASFGMMSIDRTALDTTDRDPTLLGAQEAAIQADFVQIMPGGNLDTTWSVDVSPDDRWTATGSFDEKVKIWDNQSGDLKSSFNDHHGMVWRVRFSPDSKIVASGSENEAEEYGEIMLWRPESKEEIGSMKLGTRLIGGMDFHPEHNWLAASSFDGNIGIANFETRQWLALAQPFRQPIMDVQFSRCGNFLAAACLGNGVAIWPVTGPDANDPQPLMNPQILAEPDERIWAVAFSQDNRILAAGCESGKVVFYDFESRRRIAALQTGSVRIRYLRFSPGDSRLWGSVFVGEGFSINLHKFRGELGRLNLGW